MASLKQAIASEKVKEKNGKLIVNHKEVEYTIDTGAEISTANEAGNTKIGQIKVWDDQEKVE